MTGTLAEITGINARAVEQLQFRAQIRARYARSTIGPCAFGNCSVSYDPVTRRIISSFGPVGCACDHLPGWAAEHPAQKPQPAFAGALPRGRHGSRVQRSRRRHRDVGASGLMTWAESLHETTENGHEHG